MSELGGLIIAILAIVSLVVSLIVYLRIRALRKPVARINKQVDEFAQSFQRLKEESYKATESLLDFIVAMLIFLAAPLESDAESDADERVAEVMENMSPDIVMRLQTRLLKDVPVLAERVFGTDSPTTKQVSEIIEKTKERAYDEDEDASED